MSDISENTPALHLTIHVAMIALLFGTSIGILPLPLTAVLNALKSAVLQRLPSQHLHGNASQFSQVPSY